MRPVGRPALYYEDVFLRGFVLWHLLTEDLEYLRPDRSSWPEAVQIDIEQAKASEAPGRKAVQITILRDRNMPKFRRAGIMVLFRETVFPLVMFYNLCPKVSIKMTPTVCSNCSM
ncbi:hypothetical protein ElyMa_006689100 [Elysia marginata]|uniref:Uncharacterized protein n=1 Tax=Elysia marginata TaxID=1093978 RepID=A0AAV4ITQ8_9GAST|nr:hypothetical protein ElyMa_006689100 [Elysia marginata]